ncbi:MAG: glycoside hydrolase family 127 protein [Abditibacteriota bacterium]|nr:glycoside hydrolase family 127 protein [Abditibacteriota bacterium]
MKKAILLLLVLALCGSALCGEFDKYALKPLDYKGVFLKGELKRQFEETAAFYYGLSDDFLLYPFRVRASLPAPGGSMGGVYAGHGPFGQFLSGYARAYAATGDEKYRDKALHLMTEWGRTIDDAGYGFPLKDGFLVAYQYEKLMGGLADVYHYCNAPEAKAYMDRITDWAEKNIPRDKAYCDVTGAMTGEWYTLSENLYRVYLFTGDERYKRFAEVWEYTEYWDEVASGDWNAIYSHPGWHHGYSHVNTFASLGAAYAAGRGDWYLETLKTAYGFVQDEQCFATGGYGAAEVLLPRQGVIMTAKTNHNTFETQCGSWAGFKIVKYLTGFTGEARYGDWTEKLIINGVGASLPTSGYGVTFYYSDYAAEGAEKILKPDMGWPCCSGTRAEAVPDYHDQLYYRDGSNIYISQFFASGAEIDVKGVRVRLEQTTAFPEEEKTLINVDPEEPAVFGLCFRIPAWADRGVSLTVNGKRIPFEKLRGWGRALRKWRPGDRAEISFPMSLYACRLFGERDNPYVVMYGPTALVCMKKGVPENPYRLLDPDTIAGELVREEGMVWRHRDRPEIEFRPFYALGEGEAYYMYIADPAEHYLGAVYKGGWDKRGSVMVTGTPGIVAEKKIWGRGVRISALRYDDCGIMDVYIDGEKAGEIDLFGPERGEKASFEFFAPTKGKHTVRVVTTDRRNPESKDGIFNIERIDGIVN